LAVTLTTVLLLLCLEFGREISLWIESKRSATVTSTDYSQLFILTRSDLDNVLIRFPEVIITLATNAVASCLRVPSMTPALVGIDAKTSERIARRMAFSKQDFENGDIICLAGEDATVGYVIRTGKVNAEIGDGRLEVLSDLRCVGMTEIFAQERYQETVRAKGLVQAYRLTKEDIADLLISDVTYDFPRIQKVAKAHFQKVHRGHVVMRWSLLMNQRLSLEEDSCVSSARGLTKKTSMFSHMANTFSRSDPDVFLDSAGRQVHLKKQPLEMVRIRSDLDESNT
jgi:CRP-like cAMP-binding protein